MHGALALLLASALRAAEDPVGHAIAAYNAGDHKRAFALLEPAARAGDPEAQLNLGHLYELGRGAPKDRSRALRLWDQAAAGGAAEGALYAGLLRISGKAEQAKGIEQLKTAARAGHPLAQTVLGSMQLEGNVMPRDYVAAFKWLSAAADQGHRDGQTNLGTIYERGRGVRANKTEAYKWYLLGLWQKAEGADRLEAELRKRMTLAEWEEAKRRAYAFKPSRTYKADRSVRIPRN